MPDVPADPYRRFAPPTPPPPGPVPAQSPKEDDAPLPAESDGPRGDGTADTGSAHAAPTDAESDGPAETGPTEPLARADAGVLAPASPTYGSAPNPLWGTPPAPTMPRPGQEHVAAPSPAGPDIARALAEPPLRWPKEPAPGRPTRQPAGPRAGARRRAGTIAASLAIGLGLGWIVAEVVDINTGHSAAGRPTGTAQAIPAVAGSGPTSSGASPAAGGAARQYAAPPWAAPVVASGVLVGSYRGDGFTMDVYRVARVTVTNGSYDDPASAHNFSAQDGLKAGDVVHVYSCVITNTGTDPLTVTQSFVRVNMYYDDEASYGSLYNYRLEKRYAIDGWVRGLDDYLGQTGELPRGNSVSVGAIKLERPGKILNFEAALQLDESGDDERYGALHLLIE